jgi:hypothetical protein
MPLIVPIILLIVGSIVVGKIVIQITGFQINIGITILVIITILITMLISFILGIGYLFFIIVSMITKSKMPLVYRIATSIFLPILRLYEWIYERGQSKEDQKADKADLEEIKTALKNYEQRIKQEEPPAQTQQQ